MLIKQKQQLDLVLSWLRREQFNWFVYFFFGRMRAKRWWSGPKEIYVIANMVWVVKIFSHRKLSIRRKSMSFDCMLLPLSQNIQKISRSNGANLGKSLTHKRKDVWFFSAYLEFDHDVPISIDFLPECVSSSFPKRFILLTFMWFVQSNENVYYFVVVHLIARTQLSFAKWININAIYSNKYLALPDTRT